MLRHRDKKQCDEKIDFLYNDGLRIRYGVQQAGIHSGAQY